ncbi:AvrD family protein [Cupriavidus basilensis]|uniref:AvrD family protein n=1 Tax=Cupriavidus basilensis TaxID=68895 RepID=UPI00157B58D9|nr:AvrD family protein [Cupriavidus basilensis]
MHFSARADANRARQHPSQRGQSRHFADIDQLLGPREQRYFGSGFKRVQYRVIAPCTDIAALPCQGKVAVIYPQDWSRKSTGATAPPHLSTVDATHLGAMLSEWAVAQRFTTSPAEPEVLINRCEIRSGNAPDEQLDALPYAIHRIVTEPLTDRRSLYRFSTRIELQLGSMELAVTLTHNGQPRNNATHFDNTGMLEHDAPQSVAGRLAIGGVYGIDLHHLMLGPDGGHAIAETIFSAPTSVYRTLSNVEFVLACAQMAQAVIYQKDRISRTRSNTLWMRDFIISTAVPCKVRRQQLIELYTLSHKRRRANGSNWSVFRFLCQLGAMTATFTFAHHLPATEEDALPASGD